MATKLTLRIDEKLINRAKAYAKKSGKSVSKLVADFFTLLGRGEEEASLKITPKVMSLRGAFRDSDFNVDEHKRHLEKKYL